MMNSGTYVRRAPEVLRVKCRTRQRAVSRHRNWRVALPVGLVVAVAMAFGILGLLNAETLGAQAIDATALQLPFDIHTLS